MKTGDKIKFFPNTNLRAYKDMIHNMGFEYKVVGNYIYIGEDLNAKNKEKMEKGQQLVTAMKEKGYSIGQFAEILDVSYGTVLNWRVGRSTPTKALRSEINSLLDLNI